MPIGPNGNETSEGLIAAPVVESYVPILLLAGRVIKIVSQRAVSGIAKKTMAVASQLSVESLKLLSEGLVFMGFDCASLSKFALLPARA